MRNPVGLFSERHVRTLSPKLPVCRFSAVVLQEGLHLLLIFKNSLKQVTNLHKIETNHIIDSNNFHNAQ